jgi:uncharacterized protein with von Willebrand factor type A (vWA) domain
MFSCSAPEKLNSFYGIETSESNKIVYLVDVSASMGGKKEKVKEFDSFVKEGIAIGVKKETHRAVKDLPGGEIIGAAGGVAVDLLLEEKKKLPKAKKQLILSIKGLSENASFTVIFFGSKIKKWQDNLVPASEFNKNRAISYINQMKAKGGTNMSDAIEEAFNIIGTGTNTSSQVETIFLLTDGAPTRGKTTKRDSIIAKTAEWNQLRQVRINTIGLGDDCKVEFLNELANENNGIFVHK